MKSKLLFMAILLLAFFLRIYGINWDNNQHLHPDERFLTMAGTNMHLPSSFGEYLDPGTSSLNPYNQPDIKFFVYGTLPLSLTKFVAVLYGMDHYNGIVLVGRFLSALADVGTFLFVYLIALVMERKYKLDSKIKYVAAFIYAIAVLPIQQAHFFTVDSFAVFFSLGLVYSMLLFVDKQHLRYILCAAVFMGLSIGSKMSSVFLAPLAGLLFLYGSAKIPHKKSLWAGAYLLAGVLTTYAVLRIVDPRIFATGSWLNLTLNPQFLTNLRELNTLSSKTSWFPPAVQWHSKTPILFPLQNIALFGLGLPAFVFMLIGSFQTWKIKNYELRIISIWMLGFFIYQGVQFATSMRYFYLLYPFFAVLSGVGVVYVFEQIKRARTLWGGIILVVLLIWPLSFMSIYTHPHTRVEASQWIYTNVPKNSYIATEHWDDPLPLILGPESMIYGFHGEQLPVFADDTAEKWSEMERILSEADYYVLSSNRGYGSMLPLPDRYPKTTRFYSDLLAGKGGFEQVAEFTSYPTIPLLGIRINDQLAEEAFTVYDHPRVLIFKKK